MYESMYKHALNTLARIEVIWSTKPIWNICIIQYFSSVGNSNKQLSNETLVGAKIQTSGGITNSAVLLPWGYDINLIMVLVFPYLLYLYFSLLCRNDIRRE
jgi:hypothetical protein